MILAKLLENVPSITIILTCLSIYLIYLSIYDPRNKKAKCIAQPSSLFFQIKVKNSI